MKHYKNDLTLIPTDSHESRNFIFDSLQPIGSDSDININAGARTILV